MEQSVVVSQGKLMRRGYTTGSCAAAASKAAAVMLLSGEETDTIKLDTPKGITLTLEVGAATEEEAGLLEISPGMPLFILKETITSQETGLPVHWTKQVMSGNYFKYTITSSNNSLGINLKNDLEKKEA